LKNPEALRQAGIDKLIADAIWPSTAVTPDRLSNFQTHGAVRFNWPVKQPWRHGPKKQGAQLFGLCRYH
jgi:hypothetical protein